MSPAAPARYRGAITSALPPVGRQHAKSARRLMSTGTGTPIRRELLLSFVRAGRSPPRRLPQPSRRAAARRLPAVPCRSRERRVRPSARASTRTATILAHLHTQPSPPSAATTRPIPPALDGLVLACLAKEPHFRPHTAEALAARLAARLAAVNDFIVCSITTNTSTDINYQIAGSDGNSPVLSRYDAFGHRASSMSPHGLSA